jgi:hypothetical protein
MKPITRRNQRALEPMMPVQELRVAYLLREDSHAGGVQMGEGFLHQRLHCRVGQEVLQRNTHRRAVREYEVDTQAIHTEAPGMFTIVYIASTADGLDKVNTALDETIKSDPLGGVAFTSMIDVSAHHDELGRTNATYK